MDFSSGSYKSGWLWLLPDHLVLHYGTGVMKHPTVTACASRKLVADPCSSLSGTNWKYSMYPIPAFPANHYEEKAFRA